MILISTFNILILVLMFCMYQSFPQRDEYELVQVGLKHLIFAFLSPWLAFYLSQMIISQQVIETNEYASAIVDGGLGWIFQAIAILTVGVFIYLFSIMIRSRMQDVKK